LVPSLAAPEARPVVRGNRRGIGRRQWTNALRRIEEREVPDVEIARQRLAVEPADRPSRVVVDEDLIGGALLGAAQEDPAVDAEIDPRLEHELDIPETLVADQDAAIAGKILRADDRPVLHPP